MLCRVAHSQLHRSNSFACSASFAVKLLSVPKKKKPKPFRAASAVKAMARNAIGTPPPVKRAESKKRRKQEKHKPTIGKLLSDAE